MKKTLQSIPVLGSFSKGMSRTVDLFGQLDDQQAPQKEQDLEILASDWETVGKDLEDAITTYEQQAKQPAKKTEK